MAVFENGAASQTVATSNGYIVWTVAIIGVQTVRFIRLQDSFGRRQCAKCYAFCRRSRTLSCNGKDKNDCQNSKTHKAPSTLRCPFMSQCQRHNRITFQIIYKPIMAMSSTEMTASNDISRAQSTRIMECLIPTATRGSRDIFLL